MANAWSAKQLNEADKKVDASYEDFPNRKRQTIADSFVREKEAEIRRLKGELEKSRNLLQKTVIDHVRRDELLFSDLGLNTREGVHFNARAEAAEGEREAYRILMNEAREALSASRADALKEALEAVHVRKGEGLSHPRTKGDKAYAKAFEHAEQSILARMEKAS